MKKYRIANKFRFISCLTLMLVIGIFTISSIFGAYNASGLENRRYVTIMVTSGDTLWDLAGQYGPKDQDVRKTIYDICKLNDISAADIYAGQYITIPQGK